MSEILQKEVIFLREQTADLDTQNQKLQESLNLLEAQLQAAKEEAFAFREKATSFKEEYDRLVQAFLALQRERFGKKSERFVDEENLQSSLFETTEALAENSAETPPDPEDIEEITYTRKKRTAQDRSGIPEREVIIEVSKEKRVCSCGCQKEVIRYETSQRLNFQPAVLELITEKREVRACRKGCDGSVVTAPLANRILPKCQATESLLAYIAISKVLDRQPLYHLEKSIKQRYNWHIPRQTMARWLIQLSEKLQPLINLMKDHLIDYDVASLDATTLQVLKEPARPAETKSYAYCLRGGPPGKEVILYEYNAYSQKDYVTETLLDFKGYLHCDASPVTNGVGAQPEVTLSYCHAHARRKFEQIVGPGKKGKHPIAREALRIYQELYKIERQAKDENLSPEKRHALRLEKSHPILISFHDWLQKTKEKTLPKSPVGKAIAYTLTHWEKLLTFLKDGRLEIDNNATERDIKPFVIARKNFLFAATQAGADALGVHFSLILTARLHGLNPIDYYTSILKKIPNCTRFEDFEMLLPWNFKPD